MCVSECELVWVLVSWGCLCVCVGVDVRVDVGEEESRSITQAYNSYISIYIYKKALQSETIFGHLTVKRITECA